MSLFERVFLKVLSVYSAFLGKILLRVAGVTAGKNLKLFGIPIISRHKNSQIIIGANVVLCSNSMATALGINHPVILRTLGPGSKIEIGDDVGISGGSICAKHCVTIGSKSMLGANVTIADTDFHDFSQDNRRYSGTPQNNMLTPVVIEENVFIGTNVVILKGVKIGKNAVIGAGSIVTQDIPANMIAAGNPCKIIKQIEIVS